MTKKSLITIDGKAAALQRNETKSKSEELEEAIESLMNLCDKYSELDDFYLSNAYDNAAEILAEAFVKYEV